MISCFCKLNTFEVAKTPPCQTIRRCVCSWPTKHVNENIAVDLRNLGMGDPAQNQLAQDALDTEKKRTKALEEQVSLQSRQL